MARFLACLQHASHNVSFSVRVSDYNLIALFSRVWMRTSPSLHPPGSGQTTLRLETRERLSGTSLTG